MTSVFFDIDINVLSTCVSSINGFFHRWVNISTATTVWAIYRIKNSNLIELIYVIRLSTTKRALFHLLHHFRTAFWTVVAIMFATSCEDRTSAFATVHDKNRIIFFNKRNHFARALWLRLDEVSVPA